jgi:hypothetical protein
MNMRTRFSFAGSLLAALAACLAYFTAKDAFNPRNARRAGAQRRE